MPSILFLHLVLTHLLRCGEPISGIIFKSTQSFGDFRGCRPLGGSIANWAIFPRFLLSLSPLSRGDPRDQFWQWATSMCVCVCVCVRGGGGWGKGGGGAGGCKCVGSLWLQCNASRNLRCIPADHHISLNWENVEINCLAWSGWQELSPCLHVHVIIRRSLVGSSSVYTITEVFVCKSEEHVGRSLLEWQLHHNSMLRASLSSCESPWVKSWWWQSKFSSDFSRLHLTLKTIGYWCSVETYYIVPGLCRVLSCVTYSLDCWRSESRNTRHE